MNDPLTYVLVGLASFIAWQVWDMNGKMKAKEVKDIEQDKDLDRLSRRTHDHANTLHKHEGRISSLEQRVE